MVGVDVVKKIIADNQLLIPQIELNRRNFRFEEFGCYVFVGARQAGKSYMLYQRAQELVAQGHSIDEIVYISFDDERIVDIKAEELDLILQAHRSLYDCKPILFLDEIQNIDKWQHFARRLANEKYIVYITGSNAKMLSRDIATTLGGRYWVVDVYPYTFAEYLDAVGVKLKSNWQYSRQAQDVSRHFTSYFQYGGFPELTRVVAKRAWLTGLYNKIFFSDIIVRNALRGENGLRMTVRRLAESVGKPIAYNRISNLIKSAGSTSNPTSVMAYVGYLRDACIVFSIENYASKMVERETTKKHYFVDNGLLNLFLTGSDAPLLENVCAIHLHRRYGERLYYYNRNVEVDFYVPDEELAVQVCYTMENHDTWQRETEALVKFKTVHPVARQLIITYSEERTITLSDGSEAEVQPVWKWLLL